MSNSMNGAQVVRVVSRFLCVVLLPLTCGALFAQTENHRRELSTLNPSSTRGEQP
jgi:hypothetical protein